MHFSDSVFATRFGITRQNLESYLAELRSRLRAHIYLRAGAVGAAGTLLLTCIAVWLFNHQGFAASVAISARVALLVLLLLVALILLWLA